MKTLLIRDTLNVKEIDLFNYLVKWGKNNETSSLNWKKRIEPFLQFIRFPLMNSQELIRQVRHLGVISDRQYTQSL